MAARVLFRGQELGRPAAPPAAAGVEGADHDPVQPPAQIRAGRELIKLDVRTSERLLDQVLGVTAVAGQPERRWVQLAHIGDRFALEPVAWAGGGSCRGVHAMASSDGSAVGVSRY